MFTFDPWKLFGLKSTSSLDEARRAYYKLAIIMHPDKGGNEEDMRMLYEAYKWVYNQLEGASFPITIDDPSKTPIIDTVMGMDRISLETCYEKQRPNDDQRTKTIALDWVKYLVERDLMTDTDLKTLEEYVEEGISVVLEAKNQEEFYHASIPDGYGSYMDNKTSINKYENVIHDIHIGSNVTENGKKKESHQFTKELMKYVEPICLSEIYANNNTIPIPEKIEDYSDMNNKLYMTDYALAHSEHIISDTDAYNEEKQKMDELPILHYKFE